jgi:DNA-directed RNA polymerase subunit RPC12/RpoP
MPMEAIHPLVFWWVAFYKTGECFPQFDIESGKENGFGSIDQTKLDRFGLFPFTPELAEKANNARGDVVARVGENLPFFILKLEEGQRLINVRRNFINMYSYVVCSKCGFEWQCMKEPKEGTISDAGLPIYGDTVKDKDFSGKEIEVIQCPKCKAFNTWNCPDCATKLIVKERTGPKDLYHFCPKCQKEVPWYIRIAEDVSRQLIYILGYQTTVEGKNVKQLMNIREDGTITLKNDL